MQKLVWQNANGDEINLTGGNYGITEWEGFSNASLNIQNQQVPFQDGAVFLDALIEPRELSVTLKMQDKGNLEARYEMRRELIHALNPKLGEGYLIYTNDFISKRIKCIPQIPLFETHNSDTRGTPKASLAWTACEPYWEDLEETVVNLTNGIRSQIINEGDVKVGSKIELITTNVTNPQVNNFTENKAIRIKGTFIDKININTNLGQKEVTTRGVLTKVCPTQITKNVEYSESLGYFISVFVDTVYKSYDGYKWEEYSNAHATNQIQCVIYSEMKELFVAVGYDGIILTSTTGYMWNTQTSGTDKSLYKVTFSEELGLFCAVGTSGTIVTSSNGVDWNLRTSNVSRNLQGVTFGNGKFVAVGDYGTITVSQDGITWVNASQQGFTRENFRDIIYSKRRQLFIAISDHKILSSSSGTSFTERYFNVNQTINTVAYSETQDYFIAVGESGLLFVSTNGSNWAVKEYVAGEHLTNLVNIVYAENIGLFVATDTFGYCLNIEYNPKENIISTLSSDSDMTLGLEIGRNELLITKESGNLSGKVIYRQKYLGV